MDRTAGTGIGAGTLRLTGAALAAALGAAGAALLALALRDVDPGRAAVLAASGAAALSLGGLAAGAAALSALGAFGPQRALPAAAGPPQPGDLRGDRTGQRPAPKILDTNVIIDGRIAEVCETGLLEGPIIVPQFVLRELQYIADSPDPLKRNRGRRGLDVLARMQKRSDPAVVVSDRDFPLVREVDGKLVALARETGGLIITNDVNLNKVAELSGATVLNLNQLANALKPVVLPGEPMRVNVIREGKEPNQGVGFLEDGTMVVVDNARRLIGRSVEVAVTSSIQTSAGRMIFAQPRETAREAAPAAAEAAP